MTSLREIRRSLRTVENIKKITDAMERVAAARLRRVQAKAEQARPYAKLMKEILENLAATDTPHPLFQQREVKKTALVIITSDKGLTGAYNSNVIAAADKFLKNYSPENIDLFVFGRKGVDYYHRKSWKIAHEKIDWGGKIQFHEIKVFANDLVESFLSGQYDEVWMVYTHFISILNKKVQAEKLLNIGKPKAEKKIKNLNYIFEPSPEEIYAELLPRYCVTLMKTALDESYAAELASRLVAMQTASKNSKNMIVDLTLLRNKLRQESITKEIIEIASGANR